MLKRTILLSCLLFPALAHATSVEVIEVKLTEGGFLSFDYAINVNAILINNGRSGDATVNAKLTCGQKIWDRQTKITIEKNATKTVKFAFSEPMVDDATECVGVVKVDNSWF